MTPTDERKLIALLDRYGVDEIGAILARHHNRPPAARNKGGRPHPVLSDVVIFAAMHDAEAAGRVLTEEAHRLTRRPLPYATRRSWRAIYNRYMNLKQGMAGRGKHVAAADLVRRTIFWLLHGQGKKL